MATPDEIRAVFESYTAAVSKGDHETATSFFAADATARDPVDGPELGVEGLAKVIAGAAGVVKAVRMTGPVRISADCRHAAAPIEAEVDFGEGPQVMAVIDVMTFDDDARITSMAAYYGPSSLRDG
jgi:steroid delta-isomerase